MESAPISLSDCLEALQSAAMDERLGFRIAALGSAVAKGYYAVEVAQGRSTPAHAHTRESESEMYQVMSGTGILYTGIATTGPDGDREPYPVHWNESATILCSGKTVCIPPGKFIKF